MTDYKYENSGDYDSTPYNTPNHEFNVNRSEQTVCPITNKMCLKKTCYDCETYGLLREAEGEDYGIYNREEVNHPERYGGDTTYDTPDSFVKADNGKLQWSLMPFEQLEDVVKVLMNGQKKILR